MIIYAKDGILRGLPAVETVADVLWVNFHFSAEEDEDVALRCFRRRPMVCFRQDVGRDYDMLYFLARMRGVYAECLEKNGVLEEIWYSVGDCNVLLFQIQEQSKFKIQSWKKQRNKNVIFNIKKRGKSLTIAWKQAP